MLRDQPGITRRPNDAVQCLDPEATGVLVLEDAIAGPRAVVLPGMVRRGDGNPDPSDVESVPDGVAVAGKPSCAISEPT